MRPQGFWGAGEKGYLISGSWGAKCSGNYFRGAGEQAHTIGDLDSTVREIRELFLGIMGAKTSLYCKAS